MDCDLLFHLQHLPVLFLDLPLQFKQVIFSMFVVRLFHDPFTLQEFVDADVQKLTQHQHDPGIRYGFPGLPFGDRPVADAQRDTSLEGRLSL